MTKKRNSINQSTDNEVISRSPEETLSIGIELGTIFNPGDTVALAGELGAGKTLLTRGICQGLGYMGDVTSPSYIRMNSYPHDPPIYHVDFYLMRSEDEVFDLGLDELYGCKAIVIIEWAQRFPELLPINCWWIKMELKSQTSRKIQINRPNKKGHT